MTIKIKKLIKTLDSKIFEQTILISSNDVAINSQNSSNLMPVLINSTLGQVITSLKDNHNLEINEYAIKGKDYYIGTYIKTSLIEVTEAYELQDNFENLCGNFYLMNNDELIVRDYEVVNVKSQMNGCYDEVRVFILNRMMEELQ